MDEAANRPVIHAQTQALPLAHQTEIVMHRLLRHLTLFQCQALVDQLDQVLAKSGWGEVSIVMEHGHARRVRIMLTVDITADPHRPAVQTNRSPREDKTQS